MNKSTRIENFAALANSISADNLDLGGAVLNSRTTNLWFTNDHIWYALNAIKSQFLNKEKLENWLSSVAEIAEKDIKKIAIVCAGNIPLVAFHDILSVLAAGHSAQIKLSSKDKDLIPFLLLELIRINPDWRSRIEIVDRLSDYDAVIATGSDNSLRYFEAYFGSKPHVFRKNRTSVAVLDEQTSDDDLKNLATDIFMHFGLGCRNVSKIYLPKDFKINRIFENTLAFQSYSLHNKFKNNYDFQSTMMMMNKVSFLTNDLLILKASESIFSPLSVVHYEYYNDLSNLEKEFNAQEDKLQCILSNQALGKINTTPFGLGQKPALDDFPDGINLLKFLKNLNE